MRRALLALVLLCSGAASAETYHVDHLAVDHACGRPPTEALWTGGWHVTASTEDMVIDDQQGPAYRAMTDGVTHWGWWRLSDGSTMIVRVRPNAKVTVFVIRRHDGETCVERWTEEPT